VKLEKGEEKEELSIVFGVFFGMRNRERGGEVTGKERGIEEMTNWETVVRLLRRGTSLAYNRAGEVLSEEERRDALWGNYRHIGVLEIVIRIQ